MFIEFKRALVAGSSGTDMTLLSSFSKWVKLGFRVFLRLFVSVYCCIIHAFFGFLWFSFSFEEAEY